MNYRTLFNVAVGHAHIYGDIDTHYWSFGVTIGLHTARIDIGPWGIGVTW